MNELFIFVLYLSSFLCVPANELIITTKQGKIQGAYYTSRNGTVYRGFQSIPYAKPPIGELRFESPQEPDSWEGVRSATNPAPVCLQMVEVNKTRDGQEDCLYLNVFAASSVSSPTLPVLVFIHSGGFVVGTSFVILPDYFMDHNVVFVTLNFRIGALGFLSAYDSVIPGNYGMKDQVAALKWVKENIAEFGGNPELVTIFGGSSGGASVHFHMYSPLSAGLFQRAISQSGSAFSFLYRSKPAVIRQKAIAFGILVGCPIMESSSTFLECLRKVSVEELVAVHEKFHVWNFEPFIHFSVVLEPKCVSDAFIHEDPLTGPPTNNVPWITGINSADGTLITAKYAWIDRILLDKVNENYKRLLPVMSLSVHWLNNFEIEQTFEAAKKFYFGNKKISFATINKLTDMFTDFLSLYPVFEGMSQCKSPVYFYYYDHRNTISFNDMWVPKDVIDLGVGDGDELISLIFMPFTLGGKVVTGADLNVSNRMVERWITFARTGNPSIGGKSWDPFQSNEVNYLHITSEKDEMKKGLLADRLLFWKNTLQLPRASSNKLRSSRMRMCSCLLLLLHVLIS